MQKACGHPQGAPTVWGRMISGSLSLPSEGFFSPFPHGTRALSVGNGVQPCGMGPTDSDGVSRVPPYLGVPRRGARLRARGCHPLRRAFPGPCARSCPRLQGIPQPRRTSPPVWACFRVRSPLLAESLLISSPRGTEMFHFPRFASAPYVFKCGCSGTDRCGLLHSETRGSKAACASPRTIAACRVLRRPLPPRHPSCARTACPPTKLIGVHASSRGGGLQSPLGRGAEAPRSEFVVPARLTANGPP